MSALKAASELNHAIGNVKGKPDIKLQYLLLDKSSLHLRVYADASLAFN